MLVSWCQKKIINNKSSSIKQQKLESVKQNSTRTQGQQGRLHLMYDNSASLTMKRACVFILIYLQNV